MISVKGKYFLEKLLKTEDTKSNKFEHIKI